LNEQLKKRLVGAIVLVALAVIFVPMLLEGDKRTDIPMFGSNVPEAPGPRPDMVDIPLQVPPPPPAAPVVVERELPPEPVAVAPTRAAPEPAPAPPPAPQAQPKPVAPVQAVKPAAVAAAPKPAVGESWAVQVGSFSEQGNASRLRDSLRGKGYPAYVEQVKLASGTSYRVRVGPVLARTDAEAIQAKLAKIEQRGIVVPHP
jgi:DedD protein